MNEAGERKGEPGDGPVPPEEPFAYIKTNPGCAVRSPAALTIMYVGVLCFGIWVTWAGITAYTNEGVNAGVVLAISGLVMVASGVGFTYVGVRRWRWKREYERVMGRSPW